MTQRGIAHLKIQKILSDSWLQFPDNSLISHNHVITHIESTKTRVLHLQFPIFKVVLSFIITMEKTLWHASIFFFLLNMHYCYFKYFLQLSFRILILFICFQDTFLPLYRQYLVLPLVKPMFKNEKP